MAKLKSRQVRVPGSAPISRRAPPPIPVPLVHQDPPALGRAQHRFVRWSERLGSQGTGCAQTQKNESKKICGGRASGHKTTARKKSQAATCMFCGAISAPGTQTSPDRSYILTPLPCTAGCLSATLPLANNMTHDCQFQRRVVDRRSSSRTKGVHEPDTWGGRWTKGKGFRKDNSRKTLEIKQRNKKNPQKPQRRRSMA